MNTARVIDNIEIGEDMWRRAVERSGINPRDFSVICGDNSRAVVGMVPSEEAHKRLREGEGSYKVNV